MILKTGDIVGVRGTGFVSKAIIRASSTHDKPARISHVDLCVKDGPLSQASLVGATRGKVRLHRIDEYDRDVSFIVYRPTNISEIDLNSIAQRMVKRVGEGYGYFDIILHLLDSFRGTSFFRKLTTDRTPICSGLVAEEYQRSGYSFGISSRLVQPTHIDYFCVGNPDKYELPLGGDLIHA